MAKMAPMRNRLKPKTQRSVSLFDCTILVRTPEIFGPYMGDFEPEPPLDR
jgi:hypothetical protein